MSAVKCQKYIELLARLFQKVVLAAMGEILALSAENLHKSWGGGGGREDVRMLRGGSSK